MSLRTQCELLQLNRSTYYHQPYLLPEVDVEDQELMKAIDLVYTDFPYYGSRKIAKELEQKLGERINRKRVQRLMRIMQIEAIYPKPRTSIPSPGHEWYPYLLRGLKASYPNHIWGVDITYIPLRSGFMYLVALIDWYSRYVLSWELSDSMEAKFCIKALRSALNLGIPQIHNSDQGSQFTSKDYLKELKIYPQINISMDGKGRAYDNIFTERLWRTVKHEEVYLHDYQSPAEVRQSLTEYFNKYNNRRLHQSLGYVPPAEVYLGRHKLDNP